MELLCSVINKSLKSRKKKKIKIRTSIIKREIKHNIILGKIVVARYTNDFC